MPDSDNPRGAERWAIASAPVAIHTVPALLEQVEEPVDGAAADGMYDRQAVYDAFEGRSARAVVPPRRDAKVKRHGNTSGPRLARDENLRRIRTVGRAAWKEESGYHQ